MEKTAREIIFSLLMRSPDRHSRICRGDHPYEKIALRSAFCFGNEAHLRCMKNEAGLRPMKRGFATRKGNTALCFMFAKQTLHGNEVAASYLQSKCFISKDGASLTKH